MHNHFNNNVSKSIQDKMLAITELVKDEYINNQTYSGAMSSGDDIQTISGKELSGFIPFQDGGYVIASLYTNEIDCGIFTPKHKKYIDEDYACMVESFKRENSIELKDEISECLNDIFEEYSSDWYETSYCELTFNIYCKLPTGNGSMFIDNEQHGVFISLSIEYNHTPEILYEKFYTTKEFNGIIVEDVLKSLPTF